MWGEVRSVVMLGLNYGPDEADPLSILKRRDRGAISVYARSEDYHEIIKPRLKTIARWLVENGGGDVKVFIDTAAVMEKPLAQQAGLGWQGKHTNLVSRQYGSWLFLGAIFTTLELPYDTADKDHCGQCRACVDICPTKAFPAPYHLDARRCISYLTIEHKGPIPREFRAAIGNRIYGCDDCQLVCPWNKFAGTAQVEDFRVRNGLDGAALVDLFGWSEEAFAQRLEGSPIRRIGYERWLRNIAVALGNAAPDASVITALRRRAHHPSPLVREHVAWALGRHGAWPPARTAGAD
jgi:epoxyqueuosine reductase